MSSNPNRMQRINITLHPAVLSVFEEKIALKKRSSYIQNLICTALGIPNPQGEAISEEPEQISGIGPKSA